MHLEKEQAFYEANRTELRAKYAGKRVVIASNKVLGVYDSDREAMQETSKTVPRGSFMVKYIPENPRKEVIRISPVGNIISYGGGQTQFSFAIPPFDSRIDFTKN
jgi:hypothetical protein